MPQDKTVTVRFDEGRYEYVLNTHFNIPGVSEFEASGQDLGDAFQSLTEYLQDAGI